MLGRTSLQRYLAWRFLVTTLGAFSVCALIVFMVDFIEMLRQSGKTDRDIGLDKVFELTLLRLPAYTELMIMFAVLVGSIGALLQLNRKNELAVMRAGGMSVWQFLSPLALVAVLLGVFAVFVYNPMAAALRAEAEQRFATYYGRESNFLKQAGSTSWLRQDGPDGSSVMHGAAVTDGGQTLTTVTAFRFGRDGAFVERISGAEARLRPGYWEISKAYISRPGHPPQAFEIYHLSTSLSPERVRSALGSLISQSITELPDLIALARSSGLPASVYEVQFHLLLSRPVLLLVLVLLGATVSLRSFRSGGIQNMVTLGLGGGVGFFLAAEISRQIGMAGLVSPWVAVWVPVLAGWMIAMSVLLHQEDG
ncbi:MAG: LPS export ABC transporter permease LptG [Pseudomonadota bacterium]